MPLRGFRYVDAARALDATFGAWSHRVARAEAALLDNKASIPHDDDMAKRRIKKLSDEVKQAIDDSGLTRYRIAKDTGIDEAALSKFYNGQRGITTDTLDRLGEYLGLRIVVDRRPKRKEK